MFWRKARIGAVILMCPLAAAATAPEGGVMLDRVAPGPLPAPPADGEMGFILTSFTPAANGRPGSCPNGPTRTVRENFLLGLPAAEQARLRLPENEPELTRRWKATIFGPNRTNICSNPEAFDRPLQPTVSTPVARGLNLDDGDGSSCQHQEFTSPEGQPGIDNQEFRVMGCSEGYNGKDGNGGELALAYNERLRTGETSMVLLLRGVDSLVNDPDVEVIFATTDDRPMLDSKRNYLGGASFSVSTNPNWRNVLKGRIVNGRLLTDPANIRLTQRWGQGGARGQRAEWEFHRGRFSLAFQPDGTVKGLFGGYQPMRNIIQAATLGGAGSALVAGIDCASILKTLTAMADGDRDPKTGQCQSISSGMDVAGVPAFVNDREFPKGTAQ